MLSVKEYAARQGISVARVHQLIREGKVVAEKIGSSWVIDEAALRRQPPLSRPLSPANSWSFIALLSGIEPENMDATARWRLNRRCVDLHENAAPAPLLASWLRKRAPVLALHANDSDLADLRSDKRIVLSGISDDRAGLSSEHEVEAYVDPDLSKQLISEYLLVEAKNANVWLHLARVQADADGRAPLGLVLADLADHAGPRESQRVKELLSNHMMDALEDAQDVAAFDVAMAEEGENIPWAQVTEATLAAAVCRACGTWVCDDCGARRPYASRFSSTPQRCARCGGTNGHMAAVVHRVSRADDHDASYRRSMAGGLALRYPLPTVE